MTFKVQVHLQQAARVHAKPAIDAVTVKPRQPTIARGMELAVNASGAQLRMTFDVVDPDVRSVRVHGLGRPLTFGREGGAVSMALEEAGAPFQIEYSITYRDGVQAGVRPSPVQATVEVVF